MGTARAAATAESVFPARAQSGGVVDIDELRGNRIGYSYRMDSNQPNQPADHPGTIQLPEIPERLRNYCVYTGRTWPEERLSDEHPIPLALKGNDAEFVIRTQREMNNRLGSKVDQPVIRDPIIMFGRRDADARGHHGHQHVPLPIFRNARAFNPEAGHKTVKDGPTGFKLEMTAPYPRVIHQPTKTILPPDVFGSVCFVTEFKRDDVALCRFAVKSLLGIGWRIFLKDLENAVDANALRHALDPGTELSNPAPGDIRFLWETCDNLSPQMEGYLELLKSATIKKGKSTVMICEHNGRLEWVVSCVGYFVAALQMPLSQHLLVPGLANGQRMLITFETAGHSVELGPAAPLVV